MVKNGDKSYTMAWLKLWEAQNAKLASGDFSLESGMIITTRYGNVEHSLQR